MQWAGWATPFCFVCMLRHRKGMNRPFCLHVETQKEDKQKIHLWSSTGGIFKCLFLKKIFSGVTSLLEWRTADSNWYQLWSRGIAWFTFLDLLLPHALFYMDVSELRSRHSVKLHVRVHVESPLWPALHLLLECRWLWKQASKERGNKSMWF